MMRSPLTLATSVLLSFQSLMAVGEEVAITPQPPETKIVVPTKLITAEAFDRAESLAPKGQSGWSPNHHLGRIMVTPSSVWLQKMSGIAKQTRKEVLQKIDTPFDPEPWYRVTIEVSGDTWLANVGDHQLTASDPRFRDRKGRIGLVAKGEGAQFRNVGIWHAQKRE